MLISLGFFAGAPRIAGGNATTLIKLVPTGAVVLSISVIAVGVSLLIPA
jgi:hypothetical protein